MQIFVGSLRRQTTDVQVRPAYGLENTTGSDISVIALPIILMALVVHWISTLTKQSHLRLSTTTTRTVIVTGTIVGGRGTAIAIDRGARRS